MNSIKTYEATRKQLIDLMEVYTDKIEALVIEDMLDFDDLEDFENYASDVMQYGGVSGLITRLIYTSDNIEFFNKHGEQIFELLDGGDINLSHFDGYQDFINNMVWTAYEVAMSRIHGMVFEEVEEEMAIY